jgi:hypothetical protein
MLCLDLWIVDVITFFFSSEDSKVTSSAHHFIREPSKGDWGQWGPLIVWTIWRNRVPSCRPRLMECIVEREALKMAHTQFKKALKSPKLRIVPMDCTRDRILETFQPSHLPSLLQELIPWPYKFLKHLLETPTRYTVQKAAKA